MATITSETLGKEPESFLEQSIGKRIKYLLDLTSTSQADLARRATVTRSTLGRIIAGTRDPSQSELDWIAAALSVERSLLADGSKPNPEAEQLALIVQQLREANQRAVDAEAARMAAEETVKQVLQDAPKREQELEDAHRTALVDQRARFESDLKTERERVEEEITKLKGELGGLTWVRWLNERKIQTLTQEKVALQQQVTQLTTQLTRSHQAVAQANSATFLAGLFGALVGVTGTAIATRPGSRDHDDDDDDD